MARNRGYKGEENTSQYLSKKHIMGDVPWLIQAMKHLPFLHIAEYRQKHNKFLNSSESYATSDFSQRLCRWVFLGLCRQKRHKAFNLHYFRPYLFWRYLIKSCLSHLPNKAQIFHYLDFGLKIAHRGNTGS